MKTRINGLLSIIILVSSLAVAQTKPFRFAWLSDTHVGATTGAEDLGLTVHDINATDDIAFVVLSGDITERGSDAELELAKAILDSLNKPYYIVPGNHDTKWSESGCSTFPLLFGNDRFVFDYEGFRFIGFHQGPIMKMGDGHFAPEDVRWIDSVLAAMRDPDQPVFIVTHYPFDPGIDNWYVVLDRIKQRNTQVVLVGHGHSNRKMNFEGVPGVMGRSNLRARQPSGGYTIATVRPDSILFAERTPGIGTKADWHKLPLGPRSYARDTTTHPRPDYLINEEYPDVQVVWEQKTGYTIASTPAVWEGHIVVGNSSGFVFCLSAEDGSEHWRYKTGAAVYSTPDISNGKVVIGSTDKNIYCLDVKTGKLEWKVTTGAPVVAAATIEGGIVYIGGSDGTFRALDLRTGKKRWEYHGVSGFVETKPLLYGGNVIFGAWDTRLYSLNKNNGTLNWKWSNGNAGTLLSPAAVWPVASDGKIFIAAPDRYMTAVDAASGQTLWRTNRYQVRETVGISGDGKRVFARCMNDTVVAFSTSAPTPEMVWVTDCKYGYDIDPSMPIEKEGVVFFGTKNGLVYALDGVSGNILWRHRVGVTIVHTPVPLGKNRVLITDQDGRIVVVEKQQ